MPGHRSVATADAADETPGILYSIDAKAAQIQKAKHGRRLSMPARSTVTWFTDRPARRSGTIKLAGLAAIWKASGFTSDPPNAALIVHSAKGDRTHVVELTRPRTDHKQVSFRVRELPDEQEAGYRNTHHVKTGKYQHARVFLDDAALPPCGHAIYGPSTGNTAPAMTQCLLAPGTVPQVLDAYNQQGTVPPLDGKTIVSVCASGLPTTTVAIPSISAGWISEPVKGCESPFNINDEALIGTFGFDPAGTPIPTDDTSQSFYSASWCPAPSNNKYWAFSNPANSGVTLRVSVQYATTLSCPYTISWENLQPLNP